MRATRLLAVAAIVGGTLALTSGVATSAPNTTYCNGGLAAATYQKVIVAPNAICFADPGIHITKGLEVKHGGTFVLGDEGTPVQSTIDRGVTSQNAANVQIHFTTINGNVSLQGGSGPFFSGSPFCGPDFGGGCITWQTIEDSTINGNVDILKYDGFWHGFFRNHVTGNMQFGKNVVQDPDGNEIQTNTIDGSLACRNNSPVPQQGDSGGNPNVVGGAVTGQCVGLTGSTT